MIDLADLARLHHDLEADLAHPVDPVRVTEEVEVGDSAVTLMGVVNLSQDSTYRESVAPILEDAVRLARVQVSQGASIIDLGAEASHDTARRVGPEEQVEILVPVVEALAGEMVVSVETYRAQVARAVLDAGARVINLTGRTDEDAVLEAVAAADATLVMCFSPGDNVRDSGELPDDEDLMDALVEHFEPRLARARAAGVDKVVVDPGSGFTYDNVSGVGKADVQARVLAQTPRLRRLGVPAGHALPHAFDLFQRDLRHGEAFFAVLAHLGRAHLLRVHEVSKVRAVLASMDALSVR